MDRLGETHTETDDTYKQIERLKYGITAALRMPTDGLTESSPESVKLVDSGWNLIVKSYHPYLVHVSRSQGPNKTLAADMIHELECGPFEKVSDVYIYAHVKRNTKSYTYMTKNRKIWITKIEGRAFRTLRQRFHIYASYYSKQTYSLLPNILGLIRLSDYSNSKDSKIYYVVFQAPYPFRTYYQMKYMLFGDNRTVLYWNVKLDTTSPPSSLRHAIPISYECQEFREVDEQYWFNIDDHFKNEVAKHASNDIDAIKAMGFVDYTLFVAGCELDVSRGKLFLPGEVFGREKDESAQFVLERKDTITARHDINYDIAPFGHIVGASLQPLSIVKDDITLL